MSCRLCKRECVPDSALCEYHAIAKKNLESAYDGWKEVYGAPGWREYLQRVRKNQATGQWAKEVADMLYNESVE